MRLFFNSMNYRGRLGKGGSEIIEKNWDGFKGVGTLRIRTNRPSLEEVREKIKKAIEKIQQMHDCSIPMIEQEVARLEKEIRGIDLSKTIEKTVSEDDYYRFTTPKGVGRITQGHERDFKMEKQTDRCHSCGVTLSIKDLKYVLVRRNLKAFCGKCFRELSKFNFGWSPYKKISL